MEFKTIFNIHDLVKHKYESRGIESEVLCYEVLEVMTQTCYAGTQVFYDCRLIQSNEENLYKKDSEGNHMYVRRSGVAIGKDSHLMASQRFREDELVLLDEKSTAIMKGIREKNN